MSFFDYFKVTAENNLISKNKWLIMWCITLLTGAGGGFQTYQIEVEKENKIKAVHDVAAGFQAIIAGIEPKKIVKAAVVAIKPKPQKQIIERVIVDCSRCKKYLNEIIDKKIGERHD